MEFVCVCKNWGRVAQKKKKKEEYANWGTKSAWTTKSLQKFCGGGGDDEMSIWSSQFGIRGTVGPLLKLLTASGDFYSKFKQLILT